MNTHVETKENPVNFVSVGVIDGRLAARLIYDDGTDVVVRRNWSSINQIREWVLENYKGYIFVREMYIRPGITLRLNDVNQVSEHPSTGDIFECFRTENYDGKPLVIYRCLDDNPEALENIRRGIKGDDNTTYRYALVRLVKPTGWKYYPIPLIYASEEKRVEAAARNNTKPPFERWVTRRRNVVNKLLGIDQE